LQFYICFSIQGFWTWTGNNFMKHQPCLGTS
jgi:hypothetical protein